MAFGFDEGMALGPDDGGLGKGGLIQQRGAGDYTLCVRCNNNTGSWYGKHFVEWCYQGMEHLRLTGGKPTLIHLQYVYPLSIIKQIAAMFFSVNGEGFQAKNPELVRFVLNREERNLPTDIRLFVYYNFGSKLRSSGIMGVVGIGPNAKHPGRTTILSEIAYPPFGYVMTIDSEPPDERLVEISHFSGYKYNEFAVTEVRLPVLPTHTLFPGDYRTREEVYREAGVDPPNQQV